MIMTSSFHAMEVKVKIVLKTRYEQRQKLYQDYSLQVTNLNRKLTMDANQVKKHAEKLSNMFVEQQKFIHESPTLQKNRMEEFKSLCEEYLEKFEVLKDSWGNSIAEELRHLIATLERKCLMLHSQQETAAAPQSLLETKVDMRGAEISWVKLLVVMFAALVTRSSHVLLPFLKMPLSVKTQINPRTRVTAVQICL